VGVGTAATVAYGAGTGHAATQATSILPSMEASDATKPAVSKGRNPWTWPLIALIGILVVVLVGTLIALLASPGPSKPTNSPSVTHSKSPTPSATPTSDRINIVQADYVGMTEDQVRAALGKYDLVVDIPPATKAADTVAEVGTVYGINPTGYVKPGDTIHVSIYGDVPAPSKPADPTATPASGPYTPGQQVTVTWPAYVCNYGTTLDSYTVALPSGSTATFTPDNPVPKGTTSITVTLPSGATGSNTTVQYLAQCSGVKSPLSNPVTFNVGPGAPTTP
jgi:serine/threonine-protein kinase